MACAAVDACDAPPPWSATSTVSTPSPPSQKSGLLTVHGTMTGIDIVRPPGNTTFAARLVDEDPKPDF
jgi:hypothetical protein